MKHWGAAILAILAFLPSLAGCAGNEIKWTEEVLLHDGTVVQVKRRTEITATGFPTQTRGLRKFFELCYPPAGVYWKSKPEYPPEAFDIIQGKVYVRVPVNGCTTCMLHGYPEADALYLVWTDGVWKALPGNEAPAQLKFNLLAFDYGGDPAKDARGLITLAEKKRRDGSIYVGMEASGRPGPHKPGACKKCRAVRVQTDQTADPFLPSDSKKCDW
jgi:hypothetical protein